MNRRRLLLMSGVGVGAGLFSGLLTRADAKWSLLPPRPIPWAMKPFSSAKTSEIKLSDGRIELQIEHDLLRGVTPAMLVWWWRNIEGEMELKGEIYPRYLIWHPIDHIHFEVVKRLPDGSVGIGSVFHIVEALGADINNLIDVALHLQTLDEAGATVEVYALGRTVVQIHGQFAPQEEGTRVTTTMRLGFSGWLGSLGLGEILINRFFSAETRNAWLKHSVEEIANLQFFLPDLYRRYN